MNRRTEKLPVQDSDSRADEQKAASRKSVIIYIATLFLVVIFFILLSYFINDRSNSKINTLHERNATAQQNIEDLQSENLLLQSENGAYETKVAELEQQVAALESELRDTRVNWRNEVQEVLTAGSEKYNVLLSQYNALLDKDDIKVGSDD